MEYWTVVTLALNGALVIWNAYQILRYRRLVRLWSELDFLLSKMAIEAFRNHYIPLWMAWSGTMGDIEVDITQKRRKPID